MRKTTAFRMVMALLTLSLISGLVGVSKSLAADAFPSKEITFVCPWPPGGSSDLLSRAIAQSANKHLPKPMVVINRDGANGMVATTEMAKTKADGYAVSLGTSGLFLAQPYTQKSLGYKQDDFDFLVGFTNEPILLSVQSSSPYKTLEDLLTGVKKDNKVISYSNSGIGGFPQLALGYLFQLAGVKSQPIPFKGGAPAITALLGGHVDALACHPGEAIPHVKAGTIRPLAVSSPSRFPDLPNVPTMKEKGFNVDIGVRKFVFAPKGLPPEARSGLVGVLQKVLKDPGFQKSMADIYLMVDPMTGEQVVSYFSAQAPVMKELLKDMVKK